MYIILFDENRKANCIVPLDHNITKDDIYLFDKLPDYEPIPGYSNYLILNDNNQLEWRFVEIPEDE